MSHLDKLNIEKSLMKDPEVDEATIEAFGYVFSLIKEFKTLVTKDINKADSDLSAYKADLEKNITTAFENLEDKVSKLKNYNDGELRDALSKLESEIEELKLIKPLDFSDDIQSVRKEIEPINQRLKDLEVLPEKIDSLESEIERVEKSINKSSSRSFFGGGVSRAVVEQLIAANGGSLPDQTGNSGKFLTTDGSDASWGTPAGSGDMIAATYDPQNIADDAFDRANHTGAQAISTVTGLQTALDGKQPLDSDLTAIAALTATTDNFIVSVASAWASRTPAQVKTTLSLNNVDNTSDATKNAAVATLTNKTTTGLKADGFQDTGGIKVIQIDANAVGVNYIVMKSASTGQAVLFQADGTDTDVYFNFATKGAGTVRANGVDLATISGAQTLTNKTLGDALIMAENAAILLDPAMSADGKYNGITRGGTAGATLAFGDLCYLDPTDSRWELADANSAQGADGDSRGVLGICVLAAASDGSATTMLLNGIVRADTAFPSMTINNPQYVSETAGDITGTQPTTTDAVIRIVGIAFTADELYFNPSMDFITHT